MSIEASARLGLPLLVAGQAQKELFHNEALAAIDLAVQASVLAVGIDAPPANAVSGACWIVGTHPTGDWAGHAGAIAGFTAGGWRFVEAVEGMAVWDGQSGSVARYVGGVWTVGLVTAAAVVVDGTQVVGDRQPAIDTAVGGTTVDSEARAVLAAVLSALRTHGLIAA